MGLQLLSNKKEKTIILYFAYNVCKINTLDGATVLISIKTFEKFEKQIIICLCVIH